MGRLLIPSLRRRRTGAGASAPARTNSTWSVDLRAVATDATQSRLTGGLGKLRFDDTQDGVRLGYVDVGYRADPTETLRVSRAGLRLRRS